VERFGRSGVSFGGVDPRVPFISRCQGVTGLTGLTDASPLWDFASGECVG
jgi:hypothetical protein